MRNIVKMFNTKEFSLTNDGDIYILTSIRGEQVLKMYLPQFIIEIAENRFAVGSGTNYYNKKNFSIFTFDPITGKIDKEFGCEYYGKDSDDYYTILRRIKNMYRNNKFLLQGNNRVTIYDVETQQKTVLKNVPNSIKIDSDEEGITVNTTARSQYNESITDRVEFKVNNEGTPITGFYSTLQDCHFDLLSDEDTAEMLKKEVEDVTYEDVLNATYCREVLYYLNNISYTPHSRRR